MLSVQYWREGLTSDTDDECLPDWLSVLTVPYNPGRSHDDIGETVFSHRSELRTGERINMYMEVVRETSKAGS